jgi:hypothetical protein
VREENDAVRAGTHVEAVARGADEGMRLLTGAAAELAEDEMVVRVETAAIVENRVRTGRGTVRGAVGCLGCEQDEAARIIGEAERGARHEPF